MTELKCSADFLNQDKFFICLVIYVSEILIYGALSVWNT